MVLSSQTDRETASIDDNQIRKNLPFQKIAGSRPFPQQDAPPSAPEFGSTIMSRPTPTSDRPAQRRPGIFLLGGYQLPPIHPRCCATNPLFVKECQISKSQCQKRVEGGRFNVQSEPSKATSKIQNQKSSRPRRATSNHETNQNPKYFPSYLKTVQNSRVSLELDNLTS
jgi:hypothetical protein